MWANQWTVLKAHGKSENSQKPEGDNFLEVGLGVDEKYKHGDENEKEKEAMWGIKPLIFWCDMAPLFVGDLPWAHNDSELISTHYENWLNTYLAAQHRYIHFISPLIWSDH